MENQNTEYKESWRDEYIKWICGFANADGGAMYIGIDDKGEIKGVSDAKKLSEDLPNKIQSVLGILVDVNIKTENESSYIQILTDPYPYPVNYKGSYFYRSGATNQELKGAALDKFLLKKQGLKWDGTPEPYSKIEDLSEKALDIFKQRAGETDRFDENIQNDSFGEVLENLNLVISGGNLKKAGVLLFHPKPERYFTGATTKIGFFRSDDDLAFQDEVKGSLMEQSEKVIELLSTKYLKAQITYDGLQRKESLPVPILALREAVLNAIVHKDYSSGIPIQISVYSNKLIVWNEGELPEDWTVVRYLQSIHPAPITPILPMLFSVQDLLSLGGEERSKF